MQIVNNTNERKWEFQLLDAERGRKGCVPSLFGRVPFVDDARKHRPWPRGFWGRAADSLQGPLDSGSRERPMPIRAQEHRPSALRPLPRMKAWFAFAAAACVFVWMMLAPRMAFAVIVPVCEHDVASKAPSAVLESSCDNGEAGTDVGDPNAAPMCDERGMSREAPPRILPIADARIEAMTGAGCGFASEGPAIGPDGGKSPLSPNAAAVNVAALSPLEAIGPSPLAGLLPSFIPSFDLPRLGFGRGVYHPPRSAKR